MKSAFDKLPHAKAQPQLAEQRKDDAGTQEWKRMVAYWQRVHNEQKQQRIMA